MGVLEIKGLDGERKALVYDNYSKLIAATDTIRKVRSLPWVRIGMGQGKDEQSNGKTLHRCAPTWIH